MSKDQIEDLHGALTALAKTLDVPPSKYEDARERYQAVGDWLGADDSALASYQPTIYPQGSFALGTAIHPIGANDYDVDAVCLLSISESDASQHQLKQLVGDRLRTNDSYAKILQPEGKRCWTLKYADESHFHLDILPAIPDVETRPLWAHVPAALAKETICITDRGQSDLNAEWPRSNPKGFQAWFRSRMVVRTNERRVTIGADVQALPHFEERTVLQRAVQLLKRQRDIRYGTDPDKPISIIITTLAAQCYDGEADILDAMLAILPKMRARIKAGSDGIWVPNPMNPKENFAERWQSEPRKALVFSDWLESVEKLHADLASPRSIEKRAATLSEAYGQEETKRAFGRTAVSSAPTAAVIGGGISSPPTTVPLASGAPTSGILTLNAPHREAPPWRLALSHRVSIDGRASRKGFRPVECKSGARCRLHRGYSLRFRAVTDVAPPYDVFWQVVNTGEEARAKRDLRGNFERGSEVQKESAIYRGQHAIECFIVKNGTCVARSCDLVVAVE